MVVIADIWKNKDESSNKEQMHDETMIKEVKRNEVEEELRRQVDYLMREELDLLKIVSETSIRIRVYLNKLKNSFFLIKIKSDIDRQSPVKNQPVKLQSR